MSCKPKTFVSCHDTTISRHATCLYITILTSLFRLLCPTIALSPEEQVRDTLEVLLHYYTQALSIKAVAREVAVICLVVDINGKVAIGEEQILDVEVANETGCGIIVVTIAELTVYEQTVVKQTTRKQSFVFSIIEALSSSRNIGTEIPVVVINHIAQYGIYLLTYSLRKLCIASEVWLYCGVLPSALLLF